ncbi:YciI family protein [Algoriphagus sp. AGSA1]|uniref:YciI family protein n=1 Tax=Algoriphagus sp. AGSA1 TaxID=2907213 RepID=UPI001F18694C|nr:YciI family protein [Algoriphagus sp. AGSA1]MCE7053504.1 YciI family protein [Algoriphagus sp. AGSA1]
MEEFLLIFRRDFNSKENQPSAEGLQNHLKQWQDWFAKLSEEDKLSRPIQRWDREGKIVKSKNQILNGPYVEIKEAIGGMIFIKASSYDEAAEIANGCPILELGGNVEIRKAVTPVEH